MSDSLLYVLPVLFFCVAFAYSSVGLGGGSSYTALMAIFGVNYLAIPSVSLILNLIVTTISSFNFIRQKHARLTLIAPFFISSIPMSYLGGSLSLPKNIFLWILLFSLIAIAIKYYFFSSVSTKFRTGQTTSIIIALIIGAILGLIAGIVGIGGGIYLVPLIIILGLGTHKEAAATGALFVWVNSLSGLTARMQHNPVDLYDYLPLIIAVIVGGSLGSWLGSSKLKSETMQKFLGIIILIAIFFLAKKLLQGVL